MNMWFVIPPLKRNQLLRWNVFLLFHSVSCQSLSPPLSTSPHSSSIENHPQPIMIILTSIQDRKCLAKWNRTEQRLYLIFFFCFEERCIKLLLPALLSTTIPGPAADEAPPCTKHIIMDSFTSLDFINTEYSLRKTFRSPPFTDLQYRN